jgi:hypothetical protein
VQALVMAFSLFRALVILKKTKRAQNFLLQGAGCATGGHLTK